jgi:branched-chain amino acid transport system permease protein
MQQAPAQPALANPTHPQRTWAKYLGNALLLGLSLALPWLLGSYNLTIATQILIFGLLAMSLDLLVGYTGLVSFGHAAFFGLGGYAAGYAAIHWSPFFLVGLLAAIAVAGLGATLVGYLATRARGVYFLMSTLAFAQMIHAGATKWEAVTGGSNGLSGIPRPVLGLPLSLWDGKAFYYYTLAIVIVSALLLRLIVASPFGQALIGIRENEERMQAIGYNTRQLKLVAFLIAGIFAGIAGALYASYQGIVAPSDLYWSVSGQALVMVIIGGASTLSGPLLGAATVLLLQYGVSAATERWQTIMGLVFILFVLNLRHGLLGLWRQLLTSRGAWGFSPKNLP